jgi:hypothetical protein
MSTGLHSRCQSPILRPMKTRIAPKDKVTETGGPAERGYAQWKQEKVLRGLAQAEDRSQMIPVERILRDFGLER